MNVFQAFKQPGIFWRNFGGWHHLSGGHDLGPKKGWPGMTTTGAAEILF